MKKKTIRQLVSKHFNDAKFEITRDFDYLISLKIYGNFKVEEFRKRRHQFCTEVFNLDKPLYNTICVFQRRLNQTLILPAK